MLRRIREFFIREIRNAVSTSMVPVYREQTIEELRERWRILRDMDGLRCVQLEEQASQAEEQLNRLMTANLELHKLYQAEREKAFSEIRESSLWKENAALKEIIEDLKRNLKES